MRSAAASDGPFGALRSLMALRQVLELGCGALVLPEQITVFRGERGVRRDGQSEGRARRGFAEARGAAARRCRTGDGVMDAA